jgi:NTE family protein
MLGEMSLLTAQPAAGTVRAVGATELLVITRDEFDRIGARFPQIYRNVGSLLADRLARTNRLAVGEEPGSIFRLADRGAPPLLGWAIASSVAWHSRKPTLLLVVADERAPELEAVALDPEELMQRRVRSDGQGESPPGASLALARPAGRYAPAELSATLEQLRLEYDYVLVQLPGSASALPAAEKTIELCGEAGAAPSGEYAVEAWARPHSRVGPDDTGVIRVPELEPPDHESLREGLLPSSTAAGQKIGWVGRDIAGLKVGIALGAGSVRGFVHFGVLRALEAAGVYPDCIVGTSAGAAAGGLYALGNSPDEAAQIFLACGPTLFRPTISTRSFLSSRRLSKFIAGVSEARIEDLDVPFATVAADIEAQREIVFRRGLLWQAVVASIAIPGIYPALRIGDYTVVDGGVLNPVPCSVARDLGAGAVIGVKIGTRLAEPVVDAEAVRAAGRPPSAIVNILRSTEIMQSRLAPETSETNTVIVMPELSGPTTGSLRAFKQAVGYVDDGHAAAQQAMPRIASLLPWLRR